ncbi:MAG: ferredoxin [Pseudonocardia sp.]
MGLRIEVNYDRCTGLGLCEAQAPDLFEVRDDGSLTVLDDRPSEEHREACEAAVESCPTEALRLVEE